MKLAFCLFKYFPYGGLQRDFLGIAQACLDRGHQIDVYTFEWQGPRPDGLNLTLLKKPWGPGYRFPRVFYQQLSRYLKNQPVDCVVGFNKMPGLDIYYAADPCYVAKIHAQRSRLYRYCNAVNPRYFGFKAAETAVFGQESKTEILLIHHEAQAVFTAVYQTDPARFYRLSPGLDRQRFVDVKVAHDLEAAKSVLISRARGLLKASITPTDHWLLTVGSGFRTKGLDRSLRLLAALKQQGYAVHLIIIGADAPKRFIKQAVALGVAPYCSWLGGREDVADWMQASDLLLHPAYFENTGTVILEAIASGLPVIASGICGYAHYIHTADAGVVLPEPFVPQDFEEAVCSALGSKQKRLLWKHNGVVWAHTADLYGLVSQAVNRIEACARSKPVPFLLQGHGRLGRQLCIWGPPFQQYIESHIDPVQHAHPFEVLFAMQGEVYRQVKNRITLRIEMAGRAFFIKKFSAMSFWDFLKEHFKEGCKGSRPIVSAIAEWEASQALGLLGVPSITIAGYGISRGRWPWQMRSFLISEAIEPSVALDQYSQMGYSIHIKRGLIRRIAEITRQIHQAHWYHRDYYLCHFLRVQCGDIYLIDLHRMRHRYFRRLRWQIKDLSALCYSVMALDVSPRDYLRFVKIYRAGPLREILIRERNLWACIKYKAKHLYFREAGRAPSAM